MDDLISRQDAIDAAKHAWEKGLEPTQYIELVPSARKTAYFIKTNKSVQNDIIKKFKKCGEVPYVLPANWEISRVCEICGRGTGDIDRHICSECMERLQKILYR